MFLCTPRGTRTCTKALARLGRALASRTKAGSGDIEEALNSLLLKADPIVERTVFVNQSKGTGFVTPIDVYSTPSMIFDFEFHVRDLIYEALQEHLGPDQVFDSVGVHVEFSHSAATLIGETVTLSTEIVEVDADSRASRLGAHFGGSSDVLAPGALMSAILHAPLVVASGSRAPHPRPPPRVSW